jgi:hypothetical protein
MDPKRKNVLAQMIGEGRYVTREEIGALIDADVRSRWQIAEEAGLSRQVIYDFLAGRKDMVLNKVNRILQVLARGGVPRKVGRPRNG